MNRDELRKDIAEAVLTFHGRREDADSAEWALAFGTAGAVLDKVWPEIERAEARLKAFTDLVDSYDEQPGNAFIPVGKLRAARDQATP